MMRRLGSRQTGKETIKMSYIYYFLKNRGIVTSHFLDIYVRKMVTHCLRKSKAMTPFSSILFTSELSVSPLWLCLFIFSCS